MNNVHLLDHPLLQHKLTHLRMKETGSKEFRELVREVAMLMAYEVTRDFPLEDIEIETPVAATTSKVVSGKKVAIVPNPACRPGNGRRRFGTDPRCKGGPHRLVPNKKNEETLEPVEYYCKLPQDITKRKRKLGTVIITEPMLATGPALLLPQLTC